MVSYIKQLNQINIYSQSLINLSKLTNYLIYNIVIILSITLKFKYILAYLTCYSMFIAWKQKQNCNIITIFIVTL